MTGGSLGLRSSSSYGSLQQQLQNNNLLPNQLPLPPPPPPLFVPRKPAKMIKDKEKLAPWVFKFAFRKKIGMLFLCVVSAAVFGWVLYVGKGEDTAEGDQSPSIRFNNSTYQVQNTAPEYFKGYALPPRNPCESFVLPPPPADKKRTGPRPCPVCYLPVDEAIALMPTAPSYSPVRNLSYIHEEHPLKTEFGGSEFGGYPTLMQRTDSYNIRDSMAVHCGFVRGIKPGRGSGFDIDDADLSNMEQCHGIVVASAIFGNFDLLRDPKNISETAKQNVCFYMFLDEETHEYMRNTSILDGKKIGLWRIVLVHNMPYTDPRRNGKKVVGCLCPF